MTTGAFTNRLAVAPIQGSTQKDRIESFAMGIFKPDLYRNFGIGFVLGALAVGAMTAQDWRAEFSSEAFAATDQAERVSD